VALLLYGRILSEHGRKEDFSVNNVLFLALLCGGVALMILGINASQSLSSDFSRFFTGSPTDKSMWMLVGGGVLLLVGLVGLFRGSKATT
jgi:hypothetical protein